MGQYYAGVELIRRMRGKPAGALVYPLITKSDGAKFGKTESGAVWLSPQRTSPYRFYQFWLNTDDRDVISYLKYFTWLNRQEVQELEIAVSQRPEQREAQRRLAREMTRMVHDETALQKAEQASQVLFGAEISGLSAAEVADIFADVPSGRISAGQLQGEGLPVTDLLTACEIVPSKGEARRAIEAGGLYLNNRRVAGAGPGLHPRMRSTASSLCCAAAERITGWCASSPDLGVRQLAAAFRLQFTKICLLKETGEGASKLAHSKVGHAGSFSGHT